MTAPSFWAHGGLPALLLAPAGLVVSAASGRRARRPGARAGVPVFCCGNATLGGTGKTIVAIDLLERLQARGLRAHALTRGYRGRMRGVRRVDQADAALFGDEAILLARTAPCWVGADRVATARAAVAAGAEALVMDDGLQNFGLAKDCSLLVVDGAVGFGNGMVIPAGPLREPPAQALERCRALVLIGEDETGDVRRLQGQRPILRTRLRQGPELDRLGGCKLIAFAGIGRPAKFFDGLGKAGVPPVACIAFPDHHRYRKADLARLLAARDRHGPDAVLATTAKDAVRLPPGFRAEVTEIGVKLEWADERIERIIEAALS